MYQAGIILVVMMVFSFLPSLLSAETWFSLMRKGDQHMTDGSFDRARSYYLAALDAAGESATGQLWQKYNKAYSKTLVKEAGKYKDSQLSTYKGGTVSTSHKSSTGGVDRNARIGGADRNASTRSADRNAIAPVDHKADRGDSTHSDNLDRAAHQPNLSQGLQKSVTAPAYVEILPDGTVRMSLHDYMKDSRLSGYNPYSSGTTTPRAQKQQSGSSNASGSGTSRSSSSKNGNNNGEDTTGDENKTDSLYKKDSYWGQPVSNASGSRKNFGSSEKVGLTSVLSEANGDEDLVGDITISTSDYVVSDISMKFSAPRVVLVKGKVKNLSRSSIHNARVYVRLYNETGVFKGRKWSYLSPGRQSLGRKKTKKFKIEFAGYTGTVGSYKIEVIADFKR